MKLFITGPTYIRDEIKNAALLPEFGHRDSENDLRFGPIRENLRKLAGCGDDYEPILCLGSGSTAMEASVRSLVAEDETILNVSVGAFGDMYYTIAAHNGKKSENLKFDYGQAIDLNVLEDKLKELKPDVGFLHPQRDLNRCGQRREGRVRAYPSVQRHAACGRRVHLRRCGNRSVQLRGGHVLTATQKALALPAGFGIGFVSREAEEKAAKVTNKGHHHDITKHLGRARKNQTLTTPTAPWATRCMCSSTTS